MDHQRKPRRRKRLLKRGMRECFDCKASTPDDEGEDVKLLHRTFSRWNCKTCIDKRAARVRAAAAMREALNAKSET